MRNLTMLFCALLLYTIPLWGQRDTYIMGGYSFPTKQQITHDYVKKGFQVGGGFGWSTSPTIYFTTMIEVHSFLYDRAGLLNTVGLQDANTIGFTDDGGLTIVSFSVNGRFLAYPIEATTIAVPYFTGGVGYMLVTPAKVRIINVGRAQTIQANRKSAFSILFGCGVDVPLSRTYGLFVEGKYVIGFTQDVNTEFIPVRVGIRISY